MEKKVRETFAATAFSMGRHNIVGVESENIFSVANRYSFIPQILVERSCELFAFRTGFQKSAKVRRPRVEILKIAENWQEESHRSGKHKRRKT